MTTNATRFGLDAIALGDPVTVGTLLSRGTERRLTLIDLAGTSTSGRERRHPWRSLGAFSRRRSAAESGRHAYRSIAKGAHP
jgi:hypothetical protein